MFQLVIIALRKSSTLILSINILHMTQDIGIQMEIHSAILPVYAILVKVVNGKMI